MNKTRMMLFCMIILIINMTACAKKELNEEKENSSSAIEEIKEDSASLEAEEGTREENVILEAEEGTGEELQDEIGETETEVKTGTSAKVPVITRTIDQTDLTVCYASADKEAVPLKLTQVYETPNQITDILEWFSENNLFLPMINDSWTIYMDESAKDPAVHYEEWQSGEDTYTFYDEDYIYVWGESGVSIFDKKTANELYQVEITSNKWYLMGNCASLKDGILYIGSIYNGYAEKDTCYLLAYDLENDRLLWRSEDQTFNSMNFLIKGDVIICGYGFTDEPDFLYQIDRSTGKVIERTKLAKMPDLIVEKEGQLYIHTYSYNYVFDMEEIKSAP